MANPPKNERMFDLRVVERYIGSGRLETAEYTAHLETLDDVSENVRPRDEGGDEDGYDRPIAAANEPRRLPLSALFTRPRVSADDDDDDDDYDDDDDDSDDEAAEGDADKVDDVVPAEKADEGAAADEADAPADDKAAEDEPADKGDDEG